MGRHNGKTSSPSTPFHAAFWGYLTLLVLLVITQSSGVTDLPWWLVLLVIVGPPAALVGYGLVRGAGGGSHEPV